jgi:hypothetical protein
MRIKGQISPGIVRGKPICVRRIPEGEGYVWDGYWTIDPGGIEAIPQGRLRKIERYCHKAYAVWLDIGGYLVI